MSYSNQEAIFLTREADAWYQRNQHVLHDKQMDSDKVIELINKQRLLRAGQKVLEIGCADGYKLDYLHKQYQVEVYGIDPSEKARNYGITHFPDVRLKVGTADSLHYFDGMFDCVILGFCLYLCSRNRLFEVAAEVNRVLCNDGYIIIHDFYAETPYANEYHHCDGVQSFKMDYAKLFDWHPGYRVVEKKLIDHPESDANDTDNLTSIILLQKQMGDSTDDSGRV